MLEFVEISRQLSFWAWLKNYYYCIKGAADFRVLSQVYNRFLSPIFRKFVNHKGKIKGCSEKESFVVSTVGNYVACVFSKLAERAQMYKSRNPNGKNVSALFDKKPRWNLFFQVNEKKKLDLNKCDSKRESEYFWSEKTHRL